MADNRLLNVGANGNAPSGTKVGDTVRTAGGDFKVVSPGTAGATYNPSSGLWSMRISSGPYGAYQPLGTYHDANVSNSDASRIKALQQSYEQAKARGDKSGMSQAHTAAEAIRKGYGYSGGGDGSQYLPFELEKDTVAKVGLPSYTGQFDAVNNLYDAQKEKALAALQSAYDNSRLELENSMKEIPATYQTQANQIASDALKQQQGFNESAAYSGINAGSGSQAALAMSNQLQSNMSNLRTSEASAMTKARQQLSTLYVNYQNDIKEAVANNEYERAAALLQEYQKAAESLVSVAKDQANLDLDVAGFNRDTHQYNQNMDWEKDQYNQNMAWQKEQYNRDLAWQKEQYNRDLAYQTQKNNQEMALRRQEALAEQAKNSQSMNLQKAQDLAKYGDFSGYLKLGYSQSQVNNMKRGWMALNPEASLYMNLYQ